MAKTGAVDVRLWLGRLLAAIILLVGMGMALPGAYLLTLGGSLYYLLAGVLLIVSAVSLWRGRSLGA